MSRVLVFGGTHGNEWTGIYLVQNYATELSAKFPDLQIEFIHANPEAYKKNKRFCDEDLNRVFEPIQKNAVHPTLEYRRGLEILDKIKTFNPDWVIDLHTTTANMGKTLIITKETEEIHRLAGQVQIEDADVKVIYAPDTNQKYLTSQVSKGLMIEVGPVANSLVDPQILLKTKSTLEHLLSLISKKTYLNCQKVEEYLEVEDVFYPSLGHNRKVMIHPELQGRDFTPLKQNDLLFLYPSGKVDSYNKEEGLFPIFINEAAYYPSDMAFTLCRKMIKKFTTYCARD
ncbi:MAG: aspartoacylase [Bacteriovoracaceae bacterium]|jgi:succinylglutamate desuccinylase